MKWWSRLVSDVLDWMGRGFGIVVPETFIPVALVAIAAAWFLLSRAYQRCPHCRRVVRRVRAGTVRCRHCARQYYPGLRHVR